MQLLQTFEDLLGEAYRIRAGFPSLCPYEEVCMKEIRPEDLLEADKEGQGAPAVGQESLTGVASPKVKGQLPPLGLQRDAEGSTAGAGRAGGGALCGKRRPSLRGHRLADWDIWEAEMDMDREWESERESMEGSCTPMGSWTPMEECAFSDAGSDVGAALAVARAAAAARGR
jgi:hypothetical protein